MNKIYYRTRKIDHWWSLESGVNTNFGCMVWIFVKSALIEDDLIKFAENNGWELSK